MKTKHALQGLVAALTLLPCIALANTTVFWGGYAEGNHIDSEGNLLTHPEYTFQIGAFDPGFDPGLRPFAHWADNWNTFDQAIYDNGNRFFDSEALMSNLGISNGLNAADAFDFRGSKLYIWIYNESLFDPNDASNLEWALISGSNWNLPTVSNENHALPLEFRLGNADQAWIGAVRPDSGSLVVGDLNYYQPGGPFDVQTRPPVVIPEPSTSLLGLLGLTALLIRRNRKK